VRTELVRALLFAALAIFLVLRGAAVGWPGKRSRSWTTRSRARAWSRGRSMPSCSSPTTWRMVWPAAVGRVRLRSAPRPADPSPGGIAAAAVLPSSGAVLVLHRRVGAPRRSSSPHPARLRRHRQFAFWIGTIFALAAYTPLIGFRIIGLRSPRSQPCRDGGGDGRFSPPGLKDVGPVRDYKDAATLPRRPPPHRRGRRRPWSTRRGHACGRRAAEAIPLLSGPWRSARLRAARELLDQARGRPGDEPR
jgi:hypothetical protein